MRVRVATKEAQKLPKVRLGGDGQAVAPATRSHRLHQQHPSLRVGCECRSDWYHACACGEVNVCTLGSEGYSIVGH